MDELRVIAAWLRRELLALIGWLREPGMSLTLLVGLLLWSLAYQATPPQTLLLGGDPQTHRRGYDTPYLTGSFNDEERSELSERTRALADRYPLYSHLTAPAPV